MGKTVQEMLDLLKTASDAGSESQTAASGAAVMAHTNKEKSQQEALGGADISANTAQQMGEDVANVREAVKDKVMRAAGKDKKDKEEGDVEAKLNYGQDTDQARGAVIDAGGDPQPPPGATDKPVQKTASDVMSNLFDQIKKEAGEENEEEVMKVANDAVSYGRWMARGFFDELMSLSNQGESEDKES